MIRNSIWNNRQRLGVVFVSGYKCFSNLSPRSVRIGCFVVWIIRTQSTRCGHRLYNRMNATSDFVYLVW
jgi:hypothetical protein